MSRKREQDGSSRPRRRWLLVAGALVLCVAVFVAPVGPAGSRPHQGATATTTDGGPTGPTSTTEGGGSGTGTTSTTGTTGTTSTGFGANGPFGELLVKCKTKAHGKRVKCVLDFIPAKAPKKVKGTLTRKHKRFAKGKAAVHQSRAKLVMKKAHRLKKVKKGVYQLNLVGTYADGHKVSAKDKVKVH